MNAVATIEEELKNLKPILQEKYSVIRLGYFGSFASGTQSEKSDIDILVELEKPLGWDFFSLKEYLESRLNRSVDLVTQNTLKEQLKDEILRQTKFV